MSDERAAGRLDGTSKRTPNWRPIPPAASELQGLRRGLAVRVPVDAALQVDLRLDVLALGAHLDGALELHFQLRAGCAGIMLSTTAFPRRAPSCGDLGPP